MYYDFISVRGTNGAGKSTLMRQLMAQCVDVQPHFVEKRKQPVFYTMGFQRQDLTFVKIAILGHYEGVASGGCDNLPTIDSYYDYARMALAAGAEVVLAEGMMCAKESRRIKEMKAPVMLHLNLPVEVCFASVQERRLKAQKSVGRNEEKLMHTLVENHKGVVSSCKRLRDGGGVDYYGVTERDKALPTLIEVLNFNKQF